MRLPYTDNPPSNLSAEDQQVVERVKARRGEKGLIPLDLTLLHAPNVADGKLMPFFLQTGSRYTLSLSLSLYCFISYLHTRERKRWETHKPRTRHIRGLYYASTI